MRNMHKGSNFDEFLEQEGLRTEAEAVAIKRVIAYQVEMESQTGIMKAQARYEKENV